MKTLPYESVPEGIQTDLFAYLSGFITAERLSRMQEVLDKRTRYLTLVLEDIYQPHNAAACLRSAEGFGLQSVHVIEGRNDFQPEKGVSMGSEKWLEVNRVRGEDAAIRCIKALKQQGYRFAALTLRDDSVPLDEVPLDKPLALGIGTELSGLSEKAHDLADYCVQLPMWGFTQSFNLSVCSSLVLQTLRSRLQKEVKQWALSKEDREAIQFEWMQKSLRSSSGIIKEYFDKQAIDLETISPHKL